MSPDETSALLRQAAVLLADPPIKPGTIVRYVGSTAGVSPSWKAKVGRELIVVKILVGGVDGELAVGIYDSTPGSEGVSYCEPDRLTVVSSLWHAHVVAWLEKLALDVERSWVLPAEVESARAIAQAVIAEMSS